MLFQMNIKLRPSASVCLLLQKGQNLEKGFCNEGQTETEQNGNAMKSSLTFFQMNIKLRSSASVCLLLQKGQNLEKGFCNEGQTETELNGNAMKSSLTFFLKITSCVSKSNSAKANK